MSIKSSNPVNLFLRLYGACFVPLLVLLVVYGLYYRTYLEFVESSPSKVLFSTGLKPAEVSILDNTVTGEDAATLNNDAYAARTLWSGIFYMHICISLAVMAIGFYALREATWGYPSLLFRSIVVLFIVYIFGQIFIFSKTGSYQVIQQLLSKTIASAQYSSFPNVVDFVVFLDKIGFLVASLLVITAGLTLLKPTSETLPTEKYLANQMSLLRLILYAGTGVFISTIFMWSFTLRWALVYIYPTEGLYYESVVSVANSQVIVRGIYFSILLSATYLPTAAIQYWRASRIVQQAIPDAIPAEQANWLKEKGIGISPAEFLPRLAAILGPIMAGSISELFKLLQ